ncbi:H(2):CoB-CoM heterodisulfide,ferredoxin reductase subunit A [Candidatus Lokiarchaeum ossiferum]|uniref:CoB--CoM heterodisulfide reductase iron-sulfur subunit A n=1 Tax=Candidatus Lokiarchaeum ossiferum TaxID=2951803 RepID=A0ABY6HQG4_9ARCH|nr:H(2):CoB-CoM heterodisulfide,ferredoxin reductase subunit A [Candidatus Lokiarchaeum sp. B-35]
MSNSDDVKVGVYVCHCGKNISDVVDIDALCEYASQLANVSLVKEYKFMCSTAGQEMIADDLNSGKVNRVVVAACSPLMHEDTYRTVMKKNGFNEFFFEQANIREHASWVNMHDHPGALDIAKDHLKMAIAKVSHNKPLERQKFPVVQEALVVGGGISGMFAALDLTNKYKVHLVERSPTIGGHMAQLDKTFPTMDCSACIITPKMVEVGRHPNINLLTYSEVEDVDLNVGNFKVTVRRKASKIDGNICTGCGACAQACPLTIPNEFDLNLGHRAAAYIPFPQAVPEQYTIDSQNCIECGLCVQACEVGAIDLSRKDELIDLTVGSIILTTGNDIFDPSGIARLGYKKYKNVLTAIEFERILSSTGPTLGKVIKPSDHQTPKSVGFLQCVGSRDFHEGCHKYCSRVCCMYAMKQARQYKEKYPDSQVYIFYMDIRAFGKGYEEFYEIAAREYGINFVRGRIGSVFEKVDGSLILEGSETLLGEKFEIEVDMLILSTAIEARKDASDVGRKFGVQLTDDGMFMEAHPKLFPVDSLSQGVFIGGTCQAPRDIPDAVAQAKAAASSADNFMAAGEVEIEPYYAEVRSEICSGCRSCLSVCSFDAISFDEEKNVSVIDTLRCKGCGVCMITCPSSAIDQNHFTKTQVLSELESLKPWEVHGEGGAN